MTITLRAVKGSELTHNEVDANFTTLVAVDALALLKASNLSDVANAVTARTNLGLGTLATQSGTFSGTSSGTNTGDQTSVTGNAGTATVLATARNINGVAFNGSADITVAAAAGTLSGATLAAGVTASSLLSAAGGSFGTAAFVATSVFEAAGGIATHAALQAVHGISIAAGKTLTASNTLTLTATDGSTLAIGTGGTLGTAAYTAASAYDVAGAAAAALVSALAADYVSPLTTKGDLLGFSTVLGRLGVGTNTHVLTADSTATFGVKWAAAAGGGGDMVLASVQTVTGAKTFGSAGAVGKLLIAGTTSGAATLDAPAVAGSAVITLPGVTATLATLGANTFTALQTITQASANAGIMASTGYSLTGADATSMVSLAGTFNTSAAPTAVLVNITNTASAITSKVMDIQVGGVSKFSVTTGGTGVIGPAVVLPAGVLNSPAIALGGNSFGQVGLYQSANGMVYGGGSAAKLMLCDSGLSIKNDLMIRWGTGTPDTNGWDTCLARNAAGVLEINNQTAGTYRDLKLRQLYPDFTNTATVGAVTINKSCGQCIVALGATTVVVTNSLVTANSQVLCTVAQNDATATLKNCVAAAGSFTVTITAAATADCKINFLVLNQ